MIMICMSLKLCIIIVILPLSLLKGNVIFESLRLPFQRELHLQPSLPPQKEGCNRPTRCSEPLRYKVGGPSKVYARLCGMGPPGNNDTMCISLMLIYTSLRKTKTSNIYCYLLINFAANSKKSATVLKSSKCWQYILA